MSTQEAQATNDGHVIERSGDARPTYLSEQVGRDFGSPYNGWVSEIDRATEYQKDQAEQLLAGPLAHLAPFCKVVAK